jgi:hypothetical protein
MIGHNPLYGYPFEGLFQTKNNTIDPSISRRSLGIIRKDFEKSLIVVNETLLSSP